MEWTHTQEEKTQLIFQTKVAFSLKFSLFSSFLSFPFLPFPFSSTYKNFNWYMGCAVLWAISNLKHISYITRSSFAALITLKQAGLGALNHGFFFFLCVTEYQKRNFLEAKLLELICFTACIFVLGHIMYVYRLRWTWVVFFLTDFSVNTSIPMHIDIKIEETGIGLCTFM